jgi:hypothetical protein
LTGDDLALADARHQAAVLREAVAQQELLDRTDVGDVTVDVGGRDPEEIANEIARSVA